MPTIQISSSQNSIPRYARICKQCGTLNLKGDALPGSGWIELVLWLCYIVPGIIYSIWRRNKKNAACEACGSRELVQIGTPVGAKLILEHHSQLVVDTKGSIHPPTHTKTPPPSGLRILKAVGLVFVCVMLVAFVAGQISRMG